MIQVLSLPAFLGALGAAAILILSIGYSAGVERTLHDIRKLRSEK